MLSDNIDCLNQQDTPTLTTVYLYCYCKINGFNSLTLEHVFRVTLDVLHKLTGRAKYQKCQIFN